jgi:hypothetical protein
VPKDRHGPLGAEVVGVGIGTVVAGILVHAEAKDRAWGDSLVLLLIVAGVGLTLVGLLLYAGVPSPRRFAASRKRRKRARAILDDAAISYKGNEWGPVPLFTVDLRPAFEWTIDTHAYTEDEARNDPSVLRMVIGRLEEDEQRN